MRVVGCVPVPNAPPGSITTSSTPPRSAGRSHGGRTYSRPADQHGEVEALPALGPVVGDLAALDLDEVVAGRRLDRAELGQLALRPVDRVLDDALPAAGRVDLLEAAGREVEQLRQHELGLLGAAADREPDQPRKAWRMRSNSPSPCLEA